MVSMVYLIFGDDIPLSTCQPQSAHLQRVSISPVSTPESEGFHIGVSPSAPTIPSPRVVVQWIRQGNIYHNHGYTPIVQINPVFRARLEDTPPAQLSPIPTVTRTSMEVVPSATLTTSPVPTRPLEVTEIFVNMIQASSLNFTLAHTFYNLFPTT